MAFDERSPARSLIRISATRTLVLKPSSGKWLTPAENRVGLPGDSSDGAVRNLIVLLGFGPLAAAIYYMAHITVYLANDLEKCVRHAAKRHRMTLNKRITEQITKALKDRLPESFLQGAGAVPDFPSLEEIRSGYGEDTPRETL